MRREEGKNAKETRREDKGREERGDVMSMSWEELRSKGKAQAPEEIEKLAHRVIGAAIEVHRILGPRPPCRRHPPGHSLPLLILLFFTFPSRSSLLRGRYFCI
jgi:hypothetical protein